MAKVERNRKEEIALGMTLLGFLFSSILYGLFLSQIYTYYKRFPRDSVRIKALVAAIVFFNTVSVILVSHSCWYYFVTTGNMKVAVWSMNVNIKRGGFACIINFANTTPSLFRLSLPYRTYRYRFILGVTRVTTQSGHQASISSQLPCHEDSGTNFRPVWMFSLKAIPDGTGHGHIALIQLRLRPFLAFLRSHIQTSPSAHLTTAAGPAFPFSSHSGASGINTSSKSSHFLTYQSSSSTMKFSSALIPAVLALLPTYIGAVELRYDNHYDDANASMNTVACSDGAYGLAKRFPTFGSVPGFPHIGAADAISGWGSSNCGACFRLDYTNPQGVTKSIKIVAIDHAGSGFNVAQAAMDELTDGQAVALGMINVQSTRLASSDCGL